MEGNKEEKGRRLKCESLVKKILRTLRIGIMEIPFFFSPLPLLRLTTAR